VPRKLAAPTTSFDIAAGTGVSSRVAAPSSAFELNSTDNDGLRSVGTLRMTGTTFTAVRRSIGALRMTGVANVPIQQRRRTAARPGSLPGNVSIALLRVRPLDQGVNPFDFREVKTAVELAKKIVPVVVAPTPVVDPAPTTTEPAVTTTTAPAPVVTPPVVTPPVVTATALTLNPGTLLGAEISLIINPAGTEISLQEGVGPPNRLFFSAFNTITSVEYTNSDAVLIPDFTSVSPAAASGAIAPSGTAFRIVARRNSDGVHFLANATFTTSGAGLMVTITSAFNCGTNVADCP